MATANGRVKRVDPILGKIVEKAELTEFRDQEFVQNFKVETTVINSLGIPMKAIKRMVLFYEMAVSAAEALEKDHLVCFDDCTSQDRTYTSKTSGEEVMTSDIIAKQFVRLDQKTFDQAQEKLTGKAKIQESAEVNDDAIEGIEDELAF